MPGIDSINLWGFISGVEKTSPRTEVPICIDMPLMNGTSALIVEDYKLLLGHQNLAFWQGPSFPNASGCPAGTPDNQCFDMYAGANFTEECGTVDCPAGVPGCPAGGSVASGGCLFNLREDRKQCIIGCKYVLSTVVVRIWTRLLLRTWLAVQQTKPETWPRSCRTC